MLSDWNTFVHLRAPGRDEYIRIGDIRRVTLHKGERQNTRWLRRRAPLSRVYTSSYEYIEVYGRPAEVMRHINRAQGGRQEAVAA